MSAHCELVLEGIFLIQWVFLPHLSNGRPEVDGCNLCVSTSHRLQDGIVDEGELFLNRKQNVTTTTKTEKSRCQGKTE